MSELLLSVCIPTFNRASLISKLILDLLSSNDSERFEVCVHVDGSPDDTLTILSEIDDHRLKISSSKNQGRAGAVCSAISKAQGKFIIIYDDDDWFVTGGVERIIKDCEEQLPEGVAGYIYNMEDKQGECIGDKLRAGRSNFLAIRADQKIRGDKKEVVLASLLHTVIGLNQERYRRVPTSLFWSRLALKYDVLCQSVVIGGKVYLEDGMSSRIRKLKADNALPMFLLYITHVIGFFSGRYKNPFFLLKALAGVLCYGLYSLKSWLGTR